MLKKVILGAIAGLALLVLAFLIVVAMQPSEFRIVRSTKMAAPPAKVFEQVNDYHNWEAWSPWAKLDPNAKTSFEGPTSGVGAKFLWSGNDKIGEGHQEILESRPNDLIRIQLQFEKPMQDTSTAEFVFKPVDDQTEVTWSMYGRQNFIGKAFCLFMDMDQMVGGDFEKGLSNLKAIVEAAPHTEKQTVNEPATSVTASPDSAPSSPPPTEN